MASARKCPECGSTVTPFAAGCAVCGADLERHRAERAERRPLAPSVRLPSAPALPHDARRDIALVAIVALCTLITPIVALIVAVFGAIDRDRAGHATTRNVLWGLAGFDVALLFVPSVRYGLLTLIF